MALTPPVSEMRGRRAALASWMRWNAAATRRSAATTSGRRSSSSEGSPAGTVPGWRRQAGGLGQGGRRVASQQHLERSDRLLPCLFELPLHVPIRAGVGLGGRQILLVAGAHLEARVRQPDQLVRGPHGLPGRLELQSGFGEQEPALGHQRGNRLPRVLVVGLRAGGRGHGGRAASADARPQVELPRRREHAALQPGAVARHLAAAAGEQVHRRPELRAGKPGVQARLLDARRADAQIGVVREGVGHQGGQLRILKGRDPAVDGGPGRGRRRPLRRRRDVGQRVFLDVRRRWAALSRRSPVAIVSATATTASTPKGRAPSRGECVKRLVMASISAASESGSPYRPPPG